MIIDCNIEPYNNLDELDDILEEAIEDFGIEIFILQPKTLNELEIAKKLVHHPRVFFVPNLSNEITKAIIKESLENPKALGIGFSSGNFDELLDFDLTIFVNSKVENLASKNIKNSLILNYIDESLIDKAYFLINPTIKIESSLIEKLPLDKMLFASNYPNSGIEDDSQFSYLSNIAKEISNINFRAEQKIFAEATKTTRAILRFKWVMFLSHTVHQI